MSSITNAFSGNENNMAINNGKIIIVSGPSSAGKGIVISELISSYDDFERAVSATSRRMRPGENQNVNCFLSEEEFVRGIKTDIFFEYSKYMGTYFGTLKEPVYFSVNSGKNVIIDMDIAGALRLKKKYPEMILVYILPPDVETIIQNLFVREQDKERVRNRLSVYSTEAYSMLKGDILIVNNDPSKAAKRLATMIKDPSSIDDDYDDNAEKIFALKKGILQYLKGARSKASNDSMYSAEDLIRLSGELRSVLMVLEECKIQTENSTSPFDDFQNEEDTNSNITCTNSLNELDLSDVTMKNFLSIFLFREPFCYDKEYVTECILGKKSGRTFDRYASGEYSKLMTNRYDSLFNVFEEEISEDAKRVEVLVSSFRLPVHCLSMDYPNLKEMIKRALDSKVVSKRKREMEKTITENQLESSENPEKDVYR